MEGRTSHPRLRFGIGLLVVSAFVGWMLISLPARLTETLERVRTWGDGWFYAYLVLLVAGGVFFASGSIWVIGLLWSRTRRKNQKRVSRQQNPSALTPRQQIKELDDNLQTVDDLTRDERVGTQVRERVQEDVEGILAKRETRQLEIVAFGTISSGKSTLLNLLAGRDAFRSDLRGGTTTQRNEVKWPDDDRVVLVDTPGLAEVDGQSHLAVAAKAARDADVVLVVIDGPMRDHEFSLIRELVEMEKRLVVCQNKSDWFDLEDRGKLLDQARQKLATIDRNLEVVWVRSQSVTRARIRQLSDGRQVEEEIQEPPDIQQLSTWMLKTLSDEGDRLLMANLLLRSRGLVEEARDEVQRSLDQKAWKIVDRAMWGAGGAAALSPLPVVDLLAGVTISSKLVVDLAKVYRQDVDLDVAMQLLSQLGKNLLGILGVSLAAPTVATLASQIFKTVPGVGTMAGGVLQGITQALITRWIGAVFIEYFKNEMQRPEGGLVGLARRQWNRLTTVDELRHIVSQGREKLVSKEQDS
ncbi:MAG: DUF697 domain-containing protein [Planctomycetota bacterium]|nr:DUF697 domain-containing protein [Planctomycetota bacterium]